MVYLNACPDIRPPLPNFHIGDWSTYLQKSRYSNQPIPQEFFSASFLFYLGKKNSNSSICIFASKEILKG